MFGYNDIKIQGEWSWIDDTSNNFTVTEPNNWSNIQDWAHYLYDYSDNELQVDDTNYMQEYNQFLCNMPTNWRLIFKLINNASDFGGKSNSYEYWYNSISNYLTSLDEVNYIESDASKIESDTNQCGWIWCMLVCSCPLQNKRWSMFICDCITSME